MSDGEQNMSTDGLVKGQFENGALAVSSDGTDDFGTADGPQNLPENKAFGVAMVVRSTGASGRIFASDSSDGEDSFRVSNTSFFDSSSGELSLRVVEGNRSIHVESNEVILDGDAHLVVINKRGNTAGDVSIFSDDMTASLPTTIQQDNAFDHTQYSNGSPLGFYAGNKSGNLTNFMSSDLAFIEFKESPYTELERQGLKSRVEAVPSVPQNVVDDGLVAWYRFTEGSARDYTAFLESPRLADTTSFDAVVDGATPVQSGGANDFVTGRSSEAIRLDGTDDSISAGETIISQGFGDVTVSAFINPDSVAPNLAQNGGEGNPVVSQAGSSNDNFALKIGANEAYAYVDNGNSNFEVRGGDVQAGVPTRLTTRFKSGSNGFLELFQDGVRVDRISASGDFASTAQPTTIGSGGEGTGTVTPQFDGLIDDVRIYSRVLSPEEIYNVFKNTRPVTGISGLDARYTFEQGGAVDVTGGDPRANDSTDYTGDINGATQVSGEGAKDV